MRRFLFGDGVGICQMSKSRSVNGVGRGRRVSANTALLWCSVGGACGSMCEMSMRSSVWASLLCGFVL